MLNLIDQSGLPDPKGEFVKLRANHARGRLDAKILLSRGDFARAFTLWLKNMKYQIGLNPKDFKAEKEVKWARHLARVGATLLSAGGPMFISGGATSEETFPVLAPFIPLADLVAFTVKLGLPTLLLIIFADGLTAETLHQRFEQYLTLAKPLPQFGLRLNGGSTSPAAIYPLLVYFDESSWQTATKQLLPGGRVTKIWDHLNLIPGCINVPGKRIAWPEEHGFFAALGSLITSVSGAKIHPLENSDLAAILSLMGQV